METGSNPNGVIFNLLLYTFATDEDFDCDNLDLTTTVASCILGAILLSFKI